MRVSLLTLVICLLSCFAAAAEPIELYYLVNQRAYQVDRTKEGLPVLDTEVELDVVGVPEGKGHKAWWFNGELPLESSFAYALVDYRLKRIASTYAERDQEVRYKLELSWEKILAEILNSNRKRKDWLVLGWVHEGEVRGILPILPSDDWVNQSVNTELTIPESERSGMAVLWHLRSGKLVEKTNRFQWDWIVDQVDSPAPADESLLDTDQQNRGEIFYAASNGKLDRVIQLLEGKKKLVDARDKSEYIPLRYAVENGRTDVTEALLERKSAIVDGWGELNSIVMMAASRGHFDIVKLLMPKKPKGSDGRWHCSWAASEALNGNYEDIANYLLDFKPDVKFEGSNKKKIILSKISQGYPELGFSLMERYGVAPEFDVDGITALHSIAGYADSQLLDKVRSWGIDPQKRTIDGSEPLDYALGSGNVAAICWFIDGREEAIDDKTLAGAFAHSIKTGRASSVECLLGYGYDVNVEIQAGVTPLVYAIALREFEIASMLAAKGAILDPTNSNFSIVLARLVEGDQAELLEGYVGEGLSLNERVWGVLSIRSAAEAVKAERIIAYLDSQSVGGGAPGEVHSLASVDEKPKLVTPIAVEYSDELRARYGSRVESIEIVVSSEGEPLYVIPVDPDLPKELFAVIEKATNQLRFLPAKVDGTAVPVSLRTRLPLKADFELAKVFSLTDVDEKPKGLKMSTPLYPYSMQRSRTTGRVVVEFTLMPNGMVRDAKPIKSTHKEFEAPAVTTVVLSTWQPAKQNGKPVACRVRIPIDFAP